MYNSENHTLETRIYHIKSYAASVQQTLDKETNAILDISLEKSTRLQINTQINTYIYDQIYLKDENYRSKGTNTPVTKIDEDTKDKEIKSEPVQTHISPDTKIETVTSITTDTIKSSKYYMIKLKNPKISRPSKMIEIEPEERLEYQQ